MKKIAFISHGLSNGGAERVASILANKFAEMGHEILFLAVYSDKKEYVLNTKIVYKYVDSEKRNKLIKLANRARNIKNEVTSFGADIVISFLINETILLSLETSIPIIYSLRIDPANIMEKPLNRILCPFLYKRSKYVVFQTPDARDYFDKKIRKKGIIIGNPLTPNLPYWSCDKTEKHIITAGRLTKQKNHRLLITSFAKFAKEFPEYQLYIYGNGPLKEELLAYAKELKVEKQVHLPGYSGNIHELMARSSMFVLSSDFEGLSNSMLEALAIGIPSICTDCPPGGAALYINDGENGFLVPTNDADAICRAMKEIASDKEKASYLSNKATSIRSTLDEDVVIGKWKDLL